MKKIATLLSFIFFLIFASIVQADTTIVIDPSNMGNWSFLEETTTASGEMVVGPETTPLGDGSASMTLADSSGGMTLQLIDYSGVRFDEITTLEYSTYVSPDSTSTVQTIAFQFNVDYDLTDEDSSWQGRLVFEPYFTETVNKGEWQSWNALDGEWWASGSPGNIECPQSDPCTWSEVKDAFPDAGIRTAEYHGFLFKAGSGWPAGFDGNVDALTFGVNGTDTTYDFEVGDLEAPDVEITNPNDGDEVFGSVEIRGTVTDENPHHYWLVVQDSDGNTVTGPGVVNGDESFTDELLMTWDTTTVDDGTYFIKLEARDAFDNKDEGSVHWIEVEVNNSTKKAILLNSGVPGKGLYKAPGLNKEFNPKSKAADNAGKK